MRLVLISPPEPHLPAEAELLSAMFDRGLQQYHLRKPGCTWSQVRPLLERLKPEHRKRTMVHQHHGEATREFAVRVSLAVGTPSPAPQWLPCCALPVDGRRPSPIPPRRGASAGALQGLHYPARLRPAPPLPALQGLLQSTSLHSLEELLGRMRHSRLADINQKHGHAASLQNEALAPGETAEKKAAQQERRWGEGAAGVLCHTVCNAAQLHSGATSMWLGD